MNKPTHQGPDQVFPSTLSVGWLSDQAIRLRADEKENASDPPISVVTAFKLVAEECPDRVALGELLGWIIVFELEKNLQILIKRFKQKLVKINLYFQWTRTMRLKTSTPTKDITNPSSTWPRLLSRFRI